VTLQNTSFSNDHISYNRGHQRGARGRHVARGPVPKLTLALSMSSH